MPDMVWWFLRMVILNLKKVEPKERLFLCNLGNITRLCIIDVRRIDDGYLPLTSNF